ncbi:hypothetical protein [Yersinia alsatica]|uniref:hypothetical protein n=1 Tax=Yersinia alsatica TaxID=2890317 RepID=UPI001F27DCA9|nr:hypothetical protein [Yersinia alsatica]
MNKLTDSEVQIWEQRPLPRHIFSLLVNELRDIPAVGCKRALIIGVLNRHGITANPEQCDPPAAT